jgi:hypothetical protein
MRGGHGVHVIDLAIRPAAIVIRASVPACEARLHRYRLRIRRNSQSIFVRLWGRDRLGWGSGNNRNSLQRRFADRRRRRNIDVGLFVLAAARQEGREKNEKSS